jgi:nicotinamidase-related amidase
VNHFAHGGDVSRQLLTTLEERIRPAHSALIVVDMQKEYCYEGGALERLVGDVSFAKPVIPVLTRLIDAARAAGVLIIHVQMTLDAELRGLADVEDQKRKAFWGDVGPVVVKGSWGHEIIDEITPQPGEYRVEKSRPGAFIGTDLDLLLRSNHIRTAIVTGVITNGCVDATARGAASLDYYVIVPRDCVGSYKQERHDSSLEQLRRQLVLEDSVVTSDRITAAWAAVARPSATATAR